MPKPAKPLVNKGKKLKSKKTAKPVEPPKKRGRPSKAEIADREALKLAQENAIKEELLKKQGTQEAPKTSTGIPYPIFKVDDVVQQVDGVLVTGVDRKKGYVTRQDIDSYLVHVAWDDGTKTWAHAICLEPEPPKVRKSRAKQPVI
jgi:hypothetical protein